MYRLHRTHARDGVGAALTRPAAHCSSLVVDSTTNNSRLNKYCRAYIL